MWRVSPTTVAFQLRVLGRDDIAISQAFVELQPDGAAPAEPAGTGAGAVSIIGGLQRNLEKLPSAARRGLVQRVKGVFAFQLDTAAFTLDMKNGDGAVIVGRGPSPDVTITVSDENFAKLAAGKLSGKDAFMTGAVKIKGNLMLSVKMDTVLKTLSGNVASKL